MTHVTTWWSGQATRLHALLRIVAAYTFILAGTMKLFGWPMPMPPGSPAILPLTQFWFAGVLETFGGGLLLLGLFTRPVAFLLSGEMAVAYWQFHAPTAPLYPVMNHGVPPVLYSFLWLWLSAAGAGTWSIDSFLARRMG